MTSSLLQDAPAFAFRKSIPSDELLRFLGQTAWGCQGVQYFVKDYQHVLSRLPNPQFISVTENGRLVGSTTYFMKPISLGLQSARVAYLTQLSVRPDMQGKGLARQLVGAVMKEIDEHATGNPSAGITAYIEEANAPSLAVFGHQGFENLGTVHATIINRVSPKLCHTASPVLEDELPLIRKLLSDYYTDHALQDFETSLRSEEIRVIRGPDRRILAAVQGHLEHWQVKCMPGVSGWIVVNVLPKIGWVRNHVFNPNASRYIHVGNLYATPGQEQLLYSLMEDFMAIHNVPFVMGYFDQRSPVYHRLKSAGSFGFMNAAMETPIRVAGWFPHLTPGILRDVQARPLIISPIDVS